MKYKNKTDKINDLYIMLSLLQKSMKLKNFKLRKIMAEHAMLRIFEIL